MMRSRLRPAILAVSLATVLATAVVFAEQLGSLSGPVAGYVFSSRDGTLRPIQGALGSATIGAPVALDLSLTQAVSLDGLHFLASTDAGLLSISLDSSTPLVTPLAGAPPNPSVAAASRSGTAAALYYPAQRSVVVVTGLPSNPTVSGSADVASHDTPVKRMAVSDDGLLIYAVAGPRGDLLYGWTSASGSRLVAAAGSVGAVALAGNGDALVADASANTVFWVRDPMKSATQEFVAGESSGVSAPTGLLVTNDGRAIVANGGSQTVVTLGTRGAALDMLPCGCDPSGVYWFRDGVYRLTDRTDRTMYLLDTSGTGNRARLVFVPPISRN